jgi:transcriptional regulator with XRE-family HTH domain
MFPVSGIALEREFKDEARRRELADFLRSRRRRLTPSRAGVRSGRRRLTAGLRREEVAELAGVGTTWYTWLEQARDIRPSEVTLRSIARALQLTRVETRYVLELGLLRAPGTPCDEVATPALLSIVNGITSPVLVLGQTWDVIASNDAARALWDLDYAPSRNLLELVFTPQWWAMHPNSALLARQKVALFRARTAKFCGHAPLVELVSRLAQRSPLFRELWAERQVSEEMYSGHLTIEHPFVGRLFFDFEFLCVLECSSLTLEVLVCDGIDRAQTRAHLEALVREQERGEHGPAHNVWTALAPPGMASAS